MEVHAQTHTERKKFTYHLSEFSMLFHDVVGGFLAEKKLKARTHNIGLPYLWHDKPSSS